MKIFNVEQRSPEWHKLKLGIIGGTRLKQAISKDSIPLIADLITEIETGKPATEVYITEDMQRGIDLEPYARAEYEKETGNEVTEVGFCKSDEFPILGLSPDGFIGTPDNFFGATEYKCPEVKTHVRYCIYNKIPLEHIYQVVDYFIVNETLQWLDFVSFCPDFEIKPLHVIRTTRQELAKKTSDTKAKLTEFVAKFNIEYDKLIF